MLWGLAGLPCEYVVEAVHRDDALGVALQVLDRAAPYSRGLFSAQFAEL